MIRYLLVLQFPLLYVTSLIAGIGAYWVGRHIGPYYLATLVLLGLLHWLVCHFRPRLSSLRAAVPLLLAGTAAAAWAYRPLHIGYWQHDTPGQLVRLAALGVLSLLASHLATELRPGGRYSLAAALGLLGLLWLPSLHYALMPLLFVGLIQAVALGVLPLQRPEEKSPPAATSPGPLSAIARYGVFLAGLTLGETIMDLQEDTRWAGHLVIALIAAGVAALLERRQPGRTLIAAVVLAAATSLATTLVPDLVLHPAHAVGPGLALGAALAYLDRQSGCAGLIGPTAAWAFGLLLSFGLARHLAFGAWRVLLLIPLLWMLPRVFRAKPIAE